MGPDVSFHIRPEQIIAFVGHSCSGKSTIMQLLMRFYDANEGEILIDEKKNIKEYSPATLHTLHSQCERKHQVRSLLQH